ncbi:MAG: histidine--tRNA ligase [Xanthomonadales bacterium PRO6]|nr:Histidine--tRNA ligase [Xanthomonadales bacterium]MCE7929821.1 histidine--tRNA ligase [Xanthomonadales bacterium PRO6]
MSTAKPRTPAGTLELLPLDQIAFQDMLDTIRRNYERFGFLPVETPAFELSEMLLTKSGGETERQVYFVQSTGSLKRGEAPELALRFDLTVPLARYVAEHEHALSFPFRRYQMQRVYRGESAQRGRFREFYQCDIDVVGKDELSIRYDAEVVAVIASVFRELAVGRFTIQLNNRKLMRGFFERVGIADVEQQTLVLREVDKLDKRGADYVRRTLTGEGFGLPDERVDEILAFIAMRSSGHAHALDLLAGIGGGNAQLESGLAELGEVLRLVKAFGVPESAYALNFSIARGLDYYTGTVYETILDDHPQIGSVCSGGRYDNLASHYTRSRLPGVGISIGATRLYWQLREAGLIGTAQSSVQVLVTQMDAGLMPVYLDLATQLRQAGINTEVVLDSGKLGKQLKYASKSGIRFAVILGEAEVARSVVQIKDLAKEEQFEVPRAELVKALRVEIEQAQALGELRRGPRGAQP